MLPDVILEEYSADQSSENFAAMIKHYKVAQASQIIVDPVPKDEVNKYGITDCGVVDVSPGESSIIKSTINEAPSN